MRVPFLDLKAQYVSIKGEIRGAIEQVLEGQQFILGPQVAELEAALAGYLGVAHAVGVSSGTDALLVALMALGVGPGDRVITTAYSFFASAGTVARLHAAPIFVDINPASYNLSAAALEKTWASLDNATRKRVRAILPVHLFGQCADMDASLSFARKIEVPVVEDAAQAIGATIKDGRLAGSVGLMGCLSFYPSKTLGGVGDGGMVVTNDPSIAQQLRMLRVHGAHPQYHHRTIGGNFRLDTLQAAVLLVKLKYLDRWIQARQQCARRYQELFAQSGLLDSGDIQPPQVTHTPVGSRAHTYNQYVVRAVRRDALREFLATKGIGTEVYYPLPLHLQECFQNLGYRTGDFPAAERAAQDTLALPIYPELSSEQQAYVVEQVRAFYQSQDPFRAGPSG